MELKDLRDKQERFRANARLVLDKATEAINADDFETAKTLQAEGDEWQFIRCAMGIRRLL